jgi:4-amino-4-deoxy-L-arabinose transferase-like glycosyltransferase
MSERRIVLILIAATAALRVAIAANGGLGVDEAYTVGAARMFALGYVDHPPLHLWLVGTWAKLIGSEDPLLLRLPFIALFAGSTWLMYLLAARLFGPRAGLWAAVLLNLAPVFTLAQGSWVLPDGPLIFFMLATANIVAHIAFAEPPLAHPLPAWLAAGICGGLACLSKFHGAFLFAGVLLFLMTVPRQRRWLFTPGPWAGLLMAAIVFLPDAIWNLQHAFRSFTFQGGRLLDAPHFTLDYLPTSIGGQLLYLTPWLMLPLAWFLARALWRGPAAAKSWFLSMLAAGPIVFFTGAAFFAPALPHWPMPGWVFTFPLMGEAWAGMAKRWPKLVYGGPIASAAVLLCVVVVLEVQIADGAVGRAAPGLFAPNDPTLALLQWDALGSALASRKLIDADTPAVAASNWIEAGKIALVIGRRIPVLCLCDDPREFAYLHDPQAFVGKNMIIVGGTTIVAGARDPALLRPRFERMEPLAPVIQMRGGKPALEMKVFRGVGFKG